MTECLRRRGNPDDPQGRPLTGVPTIAVPVRILRYLVSSETEATFFLEGLRPRMAKAMTEGRVRCWYFEREWRPAQKAVIEVSVFPFHSDVGDIALLGRELLEQLKTLDVGQPETSAPSEAVTESLLKRFGGMEGLKVQWDFQSSDTQLFLDILALARTRPEIFPLRGGLACAFFIPACLGITSDERAHWMKIYSASTGISLGHDSESWLREFEGFALNQLSADPDLLGYLRGLEQDHWEEFGEIFEMRRAEFEDIGHKLAQVAHLLPPRKPLKFAVYQSYLHLHYLRQGLDIMREIQLVTLGYRRP